jgi:hypothetical protein
VDQASYQYTNGSNGEIFNKYKKTRKARIREEIIREFKIKHLGMQINK